MLVNAAQNLGFPDDIQCSGLTEIYRNDHQDGAEKNKEQQGEIQR